MALVTRPCIGEARGIQPTKPLITHLFPGYFRYFEWRAYRLAYPPGPCRPLGKALCVAHRYIDFAERLPDQLTLRVYAPVAQRTRWLRASLRGVGGW